MGCSLCTQVEWAVAQYAPAGFMVQTTGTCASPISAVACEEAAGVEQYQGAELQSEGESDFGSTYPSGCFIYRGIYAIFNSEASSSTSCSSTTPCICAADAPTPAATPSSPGAMPYDAPAHVFMMCSAVSVRTHVCGV